jgi:phage FluMu protein Com
MAKKKNSPLGCLLLVLLPVGMVISLWKQNPALAVVAAPGLLGLLVLVVYMLKPQRCALCGNVLKRASYKWTLEGEKKTVCPHCNQSLERRQRKAAMRRIR